MCIKVDCCRKPSYLQEPFERAFINDVQMGQHTSSAGHAVGQQLLSSKEVISGNDPFVMIPLTILYENMASLKKLLRDHV